MFIKTITLNNFRIYRGAQTVNFEQDPDKNIFIISGNNGYGKTSFLTSLIWCLYGKNMQEVDDTFKTTISELGGYKKYLHSCMNQAALAEGHNVFHVNIIFSDVTVPGLTYNTVSVQRKYDVTTDQESLSILIDGQHNELVQEVGKEIFIHDFLLPKEIAKFFFFDAEKNVNIAESHSLTDKRNLSKAYAEILGIKKYEELKNNLVDLRLRYRKSSAQEEDAKKISELSADIEKYAKRKSQIEEKIQELTEQKEETKLKVERLQEKLIREGSTITLTQLKELQARKKIVSKEYESLKDQFNDLMELAPFAIAGGLMKEIEGQLIIETENQKNQIPSDFINKKIKAVKEAVHNIRLDGVSIDKKAKSFYERTFIEILESTFKKSESKTVKHLHHLEKEEASHFQEVMETLRSSYRFRLSDINRRIRNNRFEFNKLVKELMAAESKQVDKIIQAYQEDKRNAEAQLQQLETHLLEEHKLMAVHEHEYANKKRILEELSKRIKLVEKFKEKDKLAERLITQLDTFLIKIKNEKRTSLEQRILNELNVLIHKGNFVSKVQVIIENDVIDIELFNKKGRIIKENLSKGEQQLYATALLKALVDESNIKFPVFVDSPMQKYDALHAAKVISKFYPSISEQVVIFPLLHKEITEDEYHLLLPYTKAVYLIQNTSGDGSEFIPIEPGQLFKLNKSKPTYA